eukprot:jgi/Mesen1/6749/ME000344S06032
MASHPYYPQDIVLENFVPPAWSVPSIFGVFGAAVALIIILTWRISGTYRGLTTTDRAVMCWWAVTGFIHLILEGAYVVSPKFYQVPADKTNFLIETWKEYSKGDSRYATRNSFVVSMEAITSFVEGPGSLLAVYAIATHKPYRHALQLAVALGQLYGDVLYFGTCYLEGFVHAAPGALYFWGYFVAMNSIWVVIPFLVALRAWNRISEAVASTTKQIKSA